MWARLPELCQAEQIIAHLGFYERPSYIHCVAQSIQAQLRTWKLFIDTVRIEAGELYAKMMVYSLEVTIGDAFLQQTAAQLFQLVQSYSFNVRSMMACDDVLCLRCSKSNLLQID